MVAFLLNFDNIKPSVILILITFICFNGCYNLNIKPIDYKAFSETESHHDLESLLRKHHKLDNLDIVYFKMLSSNGKIAKRTSVSKLQNTFGKLSIKDIYKVYSLNPNNYILLTKYKGFLKVFNYNQHTQEMVKFKSNFALVLNDFENIEFLRKDKYSVEIKVHNKIDGTKKYRRRYTLDILNFLVSD